jgi:hypothetical protein
MHDDSTNTPPEWATLRLGPESTFLLRLRRNFFRSDGNDVNDACDAENSADGSSNRGVVLLVTNEPSTQSTAHDVLL